MTVSTSQSTEVFIGNGVTNSFDFNFIGVSANDLAVIIVDGITTVTLSPSQYTVFLNPAAVGSIWGIGGTITYPTVGTPIADGVLLTVLRTLPLTQTTSISNQGSFAPIVIEQALDILEMQIQQVAARTGLFRGTWVADATYNLGDYVQDGIYGANTGNYYMCTLANTSSVWSTDLTNGDWTLVINSAAIGPIGVVYGTADRITVTNNTTTPTVDISVNYVGQASINTVGTIGTGTWNSLVNEKHGTNIASATSVNLNAATGNFVTITGNATIDTITLSDGFERTLYMTGTPTFTNGANLVVQSGANYIAAAGDMAIARGGPAGVIYLSIIELNNKFVDFNGTYPAGNGAAITNISSTSNIGIINSFINFNGTGTPAIRSSLNVSSITDNAEGDFTLNWSAAYADANYVVVFAVGNTAADTIVYRVKSQTTSAFRFACASLTPAAIDPEFAYVIAVGV